MEEPASPSPGGAPGGPDPLDVDALMRDLRRRVAEKKAKGLYGVDALMAATLDEGGDPFGLAELESLREMAVTHVDLEVLPSPDRPVVGGVLARAKHLLLRGTSQPIWSLSAQATAFHAALLGYLASLAREVNELGRRLAAEQEAAERAGAALARLEAALDAARTDAAAARDATARLADAALPERVARLERGPAPARAVAGSAVTPAGGSIRLRLEATEPDPGRAGRMVAYAQALGAAGPRVVQVGAGSGRDLPLLGGDAEGVEPDGELAAAAVAAARRVRHADPVAYLAAGAPGSLDGILVTDLIERISPGDLVALAGAIEHALAPEGIAIVEGFDPATVGDDGAFWRDPGRRRPVHPDAIRFALEAAGLGTTQIEDRPGRDGSGPRRYAVHARR